MTEKEIIRELMVMRDWSQKKLAEKAGLPSQSNITGLLNQNKNGIRLDKLIPIINALGCTIVVRDEMGSKKEWVITLDSKPAEISTRRNKSDEEDNA